MLNTSKTKPKYNSDRFYRSTNSSSSEKSKSAKKVTTAMTKKTVANCSKDNKCSSAGAIGCYLRGPVKKPKKTTKSDLCFTHNNIHKPPVIDYCKKCGDQIDTSSKKSTSGKTDATADIVQVISASSSKTSINVVPSRSVERITITSRTVSSQNIPSTSEIKSNKIDTRTPASIRKLKLNKTQTKTLKINDDEYEKETLLINSQSVNQYYKNENFCRSSESTQDIQKYVKNISLLDPIKELPESIIEEAKSDYNEIYDAYTGSDKYSSDEYEIGPHDYDNLKKLKEFRDDNYFETHSAESRIKSKGSVTSLSDHECVYRFYLNERLFPVPLNSDHKETIRCTECHLPFNPNKATAKDINGTIQAKVKVGKGKKARDMILMLPVKEPLIIKRKRKEPKEENEVIYFGVIKLDTYGNSIFNQTLPTDSLALKYQKGFKEYGKPGLVEYNNDEKCEVIVI
ncbi:hypothetical protein O0L34_g14207 [Tuta absoluta]|nr:hypothetical protein O0L34_g14207 [Tuta absoluta]